MLSGLEFRQLTVQPLEHKAPEPEALQPQERSLWRQRRDSSIQQSRAHLFTDIVDEQLDDYKVRCIAGRQNAKTTVRSNLRLCRLARELVNETVVGYDASVKLFPLSITIAVTLALLLSRVGADERCDMLGRSASQARNCHGCCEQMKCCPVSKQEEKTQSGQPASSRLDPGSGNIFAVASRESVFLYVLAGRAESSRLVSTSCRPPAARSLALLCIRLI
jgi:hypothetical protein